HVSSKDREPSRDAEQRLAKRYGQSGSEQSKKGFFARHNPGPERHQDHTTNDGHQGCEQPASSVLLFESLGMSANEFLTGRNDEPANSHDYNGADDSDWVRQEVHLRTKMRRLSR